MPADLPIKLDPVVLADLVANPGNGGFADLELKLGIDLFAGKSEIAEGRSDLREIGDSSDLPGISDVRLSKSYGSDAAGAAERREAGGAEKLVRRNGWCGEPLVLLWSIGGSGGPLRLHPFDFSSRLRASLHCGQVLRSADIKADSCDGRGDFRGESFEGPMFSGVRGGNLARCRSWREAEPAVFEGPKPGLAQSRSGWLAAIGGEVAARVPGRPELGALSGRIWRELRKGATAGRRGGGDFWRIRRHFTEMAAGAARYRSGMAGAGFGGKLVGGTRRTFGEKGEAAAFERRPGATGKGRRAGAESPEMRDGAGLLLRGRTAKRPMGAGDLTGGGGKRRRAELSKNNSNGWGFLGGLGIQSCLK